MRCSFIDTKYFKTIWVECRIFVMHFKILLVFIIHTLSVGVVICLYIYIYILVLSYVSYYMHNRTQFMLFLFKMWNFGLRLICYRMDKIYVVRMCINFVCATLKWAVYIYRSCSCLNVWFDRNSSTEFLLMSITI